MAKKHLSVPVSFSEFAKTDNPGIYRAKCLIAYAGENRNGTYISEEAFQKAMSSLYNVPVVGNWLGDNFGGHDIILETNGNDVSLKNKTKAYGLVPESANPRWETITDKFGNRKRYLVTDVLLWYDRYPEEIEFIADNGAGQSMEIMVSDGYWSDDLYHIDEFYYGALCILGKDKNNPDKHVEPCFEDAGISFSLNDDIEKQIKEFKQIVDNNRGGADKNMEQQKFENLPNEDETNIAEKTEDKNKNKAEDEKEDLEPDIKDVEKEQKDDSKDDVDEKDKSQEETKSEEVEPEECSEECCEECCEDDDSALEEEVKELEKENQELQEEIKTLKEKNKDYTTTIKIIQAELDEYKEKEYSMKQDAIIEKYSRLLSMESIEEVFSKTDDLSKAEAMLAIQYADIAAQKSTTNDSIDGLNLAISSKNFVKNKKETKNKGLAI